MSHVSLRIGLPPPVSGFSDRSADLSRLDQWWSSSDSQACSVAGPAGVGKTALVRQFLILHPEQLAFWSRRGSKIDLSRFGEWLYEARHVPAFVVCDDVDTEPLFGGISELLSHSSTSSLISGCCWWGDTNQTLTSRVPAFRSRHSSQGKRRLSYRGEYTNGLI